MESILFLKEIQKKGNVYKEVWINILMQYEPDGRPIKLIVPYGMPPSTYYKLFCSSSVIPIEYCRDHFSATETFSITAEVK